MKDTKGNTSIQEIKKDADDFVVNVLRKIPESRKIEGIRLLEGFSVMASIENKKSEEEKEVV